jgi:hypothetical protein
MDEVESEVHAIAVKQGIQSGWIKASAGLLAVALFVLGILCSTIISKLSEIAGMLSKSEVTMMKHEQQIIQLQGDIKGIQDKHKWEDQNITGFKIPR